MFLGEPFVFYPFFLLWVCPARIPPQLLGDQALPLTPSHRDGIPQVHSSDRTLTCRTRSHPAPFLRGEVLKHVGERGCGGGENRLRQLMERGPSAFSKVPSGQTLCDSVTCVHGAIRSACKYLFNCSAWEPGLWAPLLDARPHAWHWERRPVKKPTILGIMLPCFPGFC